MTSEDREALWTDKLKGLRKDYQQKYEGEVTYYMVYAVPDYHVLTNWIDLIEKGTYMDWLTIMQRANTLYTYLKGRNNGNA